MRLKNIKEKKTLTSDKRRKNSKKYTHKAENGRTQGEDPRLCYAGEQVANKVILELGHWGYGDLAYPGVPFLV